MEERKQTAVEWLKSQVAWLTQSGRAAFEQAEHMEKEQIVQAFNACDDDIYYKDGEDYYNQTYKNK